MEERGGGHVSREQINSATSGRIRSRVSPDVVETYCCPWMEEGIMPESSAYVCALFACSSKYVRGPYADLVRRCDDRFTCREREREKTELSRNNGFHAENLKIKSEHPGNRRNLSETVAVTPFRSSGRGPMWGKTIPPRIDPSSGKGKKKHQ